MTEMDDSRFPPADAYEGEYIPPADGEPKGKTVNGGGEPRRDRADPRPQRRQQSGILDTSRIYEDLDNVRLDISKSLGAALDVERFYATARLAIRRNPDLLECDHQSIIEAVRLSAQDQLLADGREGAFVKRWDRNLHGKGQGGNRCHWMPMVLGIIAKAKRRGNVKSLTCEVVFEGEPFRYLGGDEPRLEHERIIEMMTGDKTGIRCIYAIATLADGSKEREVMSIGQIETVRLASSSPDYGPWKSWYQEMARKTVIRRLAKRLPTLDDGDAELMEAIERVDELYDFGRRLKARGTGVALPPAEPKKPRNNKPAQPIEGEAATDPQPEPETAETPKAEPEAKPEPKADPKPDPEPKAEPKAEPEAKPSPLYFIGASGDRFAYTDVAVWQKDWLNRIEKNSGIPLTNSREANLDAIKSCSMNCGDAGRAAAKVVMDALAAKLDPQDNEDPAQEDAMQPQGEPEKAPDATVAIKLPQMTAEAQTGAKAFLLWLRSALTETQPIHRHMLVQQNAEWCSKVRGKSDAWASALNGMLAEFNVKLEAGA